MKTERSRPREWATRNGRTMVGQVIRAAKEAGWNARTYTAEFGRSPAADPDKSRRRPS